MCLLKHAISLIFLMPVGVVMATNHSQSVYAAMPGTMAVISTLEKVVRGGEFSFDVMYNDTVHQVSTLEMELHFDSSVLEFSRCHRNRETATNQ